MMLDFICELERLIGKWPEEVSWNLAQIADYTASGVPQVVDILSDTLDREIEVHESLSRPEAMKVLDVLKDKMQVQLAARARRLEARREKALKAYDLAMEKVRVLQGDKSWRNAYKTLGYFVGCHEKDLPADLMASLCGDCLRLGTKAEANMQELSLWLRKGVAACLRNESVEAFEDALDFIAAYSDYFVDDSADRGRRLLGNILGTMKDQAQTPDLLVQLDNLVRDLRITATI